VSCRLSSLKPSWSAEPFCHQRIRRNYLLCRNIYDTIRYVDSQAEYTA